MSLKRRIDGGRSKGPCESDVGTLSPDKCFRSVIVPPSKRRVSAWPQQPEARLTTPLTRLMRHTPAICSGRLRSLLTLCSLFWQASASAAEVTVRPFLDAHCVGCHDAATRKGG